MAIAHIRLVIDVTYDLQGSSVTDVEAQLRSLADTAANRGLLSGDLDAIVDDWHADIETIPITT